MKKGELSFEMIVYAILVLIVIALVAYFIWHQLTTSGQIYISLQNKSTQNASWFGM